MSEFPPTLNFLIGVLIGYVLILCYEKGRRR